MVMMVEALSRGIGIALGDGLDDVVMVPPRGARVGIGEIEETGCFVKSVPEYVDEPGQHSVSLTPEQQLMKFLVFFGKTLVMLGALFHSRGNGAQGGDVVLAHRHDALTDERAFQGPADFAQFSHVFECAAQTESHVVEQGIEREPLNENADAAFRFQNADRLKGLDCLAYGIAADTELLRERAFGRQRISSREFIVVDERLDAFLHGNVQRRRFLERFEDPRPAHELIPVLARN